MEESDATALTQLFPGQSEMAVRLRSIDWSKSALGPVSTWSATLRMMVGLLLANRFPILLWWGPEYVQIYNDAYVPIPGAKHPGALGQRGSECWAEIWHVIRPLVDTPFRGGPATWMDDLELEIHRHGFTEETHFIAAYSPVPDIAAPGGIGGVLATVHEITQQVIQERRVRMLRDLGARVLQARTAQEACSIAAEVFQQNPKDTPFAALYLVDETPTTARLAAGAGLLSGSAGMPAELPLGGLEGDAWGVAAVVASEEPAVISDLRPHAHQVSPGPWSDPPHQAVVVPIRSNLPHRPAGVVIFGVSARIALDELYRGFFDLATTQVATAIANAHAYEEERKRAEALAALDRAKTAFFSNVSHEFRTPLTLMLGPLEEALRDVRADVDPEWRQRLELMRRNGLRLQKLVNTLLDFARIEAGRIEASFEPTDLSLLTTQLATMFESAVRRAGLHLRIDCPATSEPAYVDRDMWEKVVMNLLSNAFKFTFEGEIAVSVRQTSDAFELVVRDTGVGIPAPEMPHLFERFHRVRQAQARTHEGTGIGLAFVQELARLHGGEIRAESELGHGTAFTVRIPRGADHLPQDRINAVPSLASTALGATPFLEEALRWLPETNDVRPPRVWLEERSAAAAPTVAGAAPCAGARIVVADDNADMRDYLRGLLGQYWSVETVADGIAALRLVQETKPELVVSDVMMPGLDGFQLLHALRADARTKAMPVILLSARAGREAAAEALEAGADAYLEKPFSARELVAYVGGHLQLQRVRRQSEAALRASEKKFSGAFDQSPLGLTITSLADGRFMEVNDCFLRLSGYSRDEVLGRTVDELNLWIEPERRFEGLARLRAGERISDAEIRFRTKSGDERVGMIGSAVIEIDGRPHVLSSVADVTERQRAERRVIADLEAMTRLREVGLHCAQYGGDYTQCVAVLLDAAVELTGANKGNIQVVDSASGELTIAAYRGFEAPFLDFFARVGRNEASACGAAMCSVERVTVEDVRCSEIFAGQPSLAVLLDAGVRAVQSTPLVSSAGRVLGMISTHFDQPQRFAERDLRLMDLLARQAADFIERKRADDAVRQRTAQFETLLNQAPIGVFLVDADFRIRQVNPTALPAFGDISDLIGRDFGEVMRLLWTRDYADELTRIFRHTLDTGEPFETPERKEFRIDRQETEYYEWRIGRITLPGGEFGVVCYFRDIAAQVKAREQLAEANSALKEANRRKDEFLAMLGHELRNPLSTVRNAVATASLDASHRSRALEIARRQIDQLGRLIDDLLDVARITQGRITLRKERVSLAEILERAIDNMRPLFETRQLHLEVSMAALPIRMDADPGRLEQVFANVLSNAAKYTDPGGRITVSAETAGDIATVRVRDTGIGIAPALLSQMWDLFVQSERSLDRAQGGLGIGLTVARRLVELHGGRIAAQSEGFGKGAEFVVTLPAVPAAVEEARPPTTAAPTAQRSASVLLVEDNRDAAETLTVLLELLGHRVRAVHDGVAALDAARVVAPDVMLVDIGLPGIDGYEVARRVRSDPDLKHIVLIALTGYGRDEDKQQAIAAGFDYHLVKPVNPDALSGLVAQLGKEDPNNPTTVH